MVFISTAHANLVGQTVRLPTYQSSLSADRPQTLVTNQRSRKTEILFRRGKIGLDAQGCFVVFDRSLVLTRAAKKVGEFFVSDLEIWIQ